MTVYLVVAIFSLCALLPFLEELLGKYKTAIYITIGLILILTAGFREIGLDPDSSNYEYVYRNYFTSSSSDSKEPTFLFLAMLLNNLTSDAHAILLTYALIAITLHFYAFKQLANDILFLVILVYVSFYFEMHEMIQIRTGVLSGFFLLAIKPIAEGRKILATALILIGSSFHVSGLVLLPILFLSNKPMSQLQKYFWASIIPIGYVFWFFGLVIQMQSDIPFIGEKLLRYQLSEDKGQGVVSINVFHYIQLFAIVCFYYLLYFYDTISEKNKYFPLLMKLFAIGIATYAGLSFLPVLSDRIGYQIKMVNIILYACVFYTILPKWASRAIVVAIACIQFVYIIKYTFFWNT